MSTAVLESAVDSEKRAQKLASAKKKLQTYRASRSSADNHPSHTRQPSPHKMPLTTEASINAPPMPQHRREGSKGKGKDFEEPETLKARHRRSDSQAHRRQRSSISLSTGQGLARPSVMGVFESPQEQERPPSLISEEGPGGHDAGYEEVAARLSSFSFGSKAMPARGGTFPPKRRSHSRQPSAPLFDKASSPLPSPTSPNRLSTPSSRPPSLLLTRPTPGLLPSPTTFAGPSRVGSPSSPPTPVRRKHHSHTRSNSISLPNLKLQNAQIRPTSLGVPISPGFSPLTSPVSPNGDIPGRSSRVGPINGQRLKFEPSGRGAEAEKEREESRRQALEKLTGAPLEISRSRSPLIESPVNEISLPELDDEDVESVASSSRPLSGLGGSGSFSWSTQSPFPLPPLSAGSSTSSPLAASPFSWASPTDERSFSDRPLSGIGFGLPQSYPAPVSIKEEPIPTFSDFMSKQGKRPSMNRQLSALQEVDESEEDGDENDLDDVKEEEEEAETQHSFRPPIAVPTLPTIQAKSAPTAETIVSPTGLRQLRLASSVTSPREVSSPADSLRSFSFPHCTSPPTSISSALTHGPPSPTKSYGTIGRGRPKPVSMMQTETGETPKRAMPRRAAPGSGSRGSSISYKKDTSGSTGSAEMGVTSPIAAMRPLGSPTKRTWGRPCPRPRGLAGDAGSGRVLNEVDETDEEYPFPRISSAPAQDKRLSLFSAPSDRASSELSRESLDQAREQDRWRDVQLDMERENQQLRDDVDFWKGKCMGFEERYESERREGLVLRERVRKLGDRLSSISSLPTERQSFESSAHTAESRMVAEMREQLFQLTGKLEQERKAKELALAQLKMLQASRLEKDVETDDEPGLRCDRSESQRDSTPSIATPEPDRCAPVFPAVTNPAHEQLSTTPDNEKRLTPDLSTRFRGWGFPSGPPSNSSSTESTKASLTKKRESFFGLSNPLRRASSDDAPATRAGVDLPPFDIGLGAEIAHEAHGQGKRVVSDPANPYSISMPIGASAQQFKGYPSFGSLPQYPQPSVQARHHQAPEYGYGGTAGVEGKLDFSKACECCMGEVIQV